jgi:hypothetical protein
VGDSGVLRVAMRPKMQRKHMNTQGQADDKLGAGRSGYLVQGDSCLGGMGGVEVAVCGGAWGSGRVQLINMGCRPSSNKQGRWGWGGVNLKDQMQGLRHGMFRRILSKGAASWLLAPLLPCYTLCLYVTFCGTLRLSV